jgi:membrane protease YdiL (CAAX protease family)
MDINERPALTAADRAVVGVSLVLPTVVTWVYFILLNGAPATLQQGAYGIGKTIQFALPIVWVLLVQRERPKFRPPGSWSLMVGAMFGVTVAAAMIGMYFFALKPTGILDEPSKAVLAKVESFGAGSPIAFLLLAFFYSAFHSLLEEYYWRWFVFGQLARACRLPTAITISSIAFAAHHVLVLGLYFGWLAPLTWLFTLAIVIGGAFWAWLYHKSDSLAAPWLSHALIDAAIFAIGYQMIST